MKLEFYAKRLFKGNGKEHDSIKTLPPHARKAYQAQFGIKPPSVTPAMKIDPSPIVPTGFSIHPRLAAILIALAAILIAHLLSMLSYTR